MNPLTGVLGEAWALYRKFAAHFIMIALAVYVVIAIVVAILGLLGGIGAVLGLIINFLGACLVQAALVKAVQDVRDGRVDLNFSETLNAAVPFIGSVAIAGLLAGIGIVIGFALIIVPGLILLTFWSLIVPWIVIGGARPLESFRRSWHTVRGHGWQVFGNYALVFLILFVLDLVLSAILLALPDALAHFISSVIAGALVTPFLACLVTLIYYRLTTVQNATAPGQPWDQTMPPPGTPA